MEKVLNKALLDDLSGQYGDSFYLLDSALFEQNCRELDAAFRQYYPKFRIAYSYKTNYTPRLARVIDRLGAWAEVVSWMEMEIALRSGVEPRHIIWNGPVKDVNKAGELMLAGGLVNVDTLGELEALCAFSREHADAALGVGLRCNYDVGDGVTSRFGFDAEGEDFDCALRMIAAEPALHLRALQAHFARRDPRYWTERAAGMLRIYDRVVSAYGMRPEILDLGGGIFGRMPESLRLQLGVGPVGFDDYASRAAGLFAEHFRTQPDAPTLFIEPGTALAGDCMRFVTKVTSIKTVRGKAFAATRGSQKNISMSGVNPPMVIIPCGEERKHYDGLDIVGFTCIEGDVLQKNYTGLLAVGDYLVFGNCGSYSLVMKPPFILPNFPVLDIGGAEPELIKRGERFEDLFETYSFS